MPSERYVNGAKSKLATALAAGAQGAAGTIVVTTGQGARFPTDNFHVTVSDPVGGTFEVAYCSTRSGDTLNVTRGAKSTTAAAWAVNSDVIHGALSHQYQELDDASIRSVMRRT